MYHIILVEDDEQIRKSLTELLTYKGIYSNSGGRCAEVL